MLMPSGIDFLDDEAYPNFAENFNENNGTDIIRCDVDVIFGLEAKLPPFPPLR